MSRALRLLIVWFVAAVLPLQAVAGASHRCCGAGDPTSERTARVDADGVGGGSGDRGAHPAIAVGADPLDGHGDPGMDHGATDGAHAAQAARFGHDQPVGHADGVERSDDSEHADDRGHAGDFAQADGVGSAAHFAQAEHRGHGEHAAHAAGDEQPAHGDAKPLPCGPDAACGTAAVLPRAFPAPGRGDADDAFAVAAVARVAPFLTGGPDRPPPRPRR